jgi:AcrR family transcriptional regulator
MTTDRETEERILDAAHRIFVRSGTRGARMQEIADEAGVNKALLHYYFRSKERLAEAVFRRAAAGLMPRVLEVIASGASLEEKVTRVVELELEYLSANPYLPAYIVGEINQQPERAEQLVSLMIRLPAAEVRDRVLGVLRRQLEEGARAGELRPVAAEEFMINLVSLCVFPFLARPIMGLLLDVDGAGFAGFIEARKRSLPGFFLRGLRP